MILPGMYSDNETGYSNHGYRVYDPSIGRELQADPRGILLDFSDPERQAAAMMGIAIPDSMGIGYLNHSYNYVDGNPVNGIDPTGENKILIPFAVYCIYCATRDEASYKERDNKLYENDNLGSCPQDWYDWYWDSVEYQQRMLEAEKQNQQKGNGDPFATRRHPDLK